MYSDTQLYIDGEWLSGQAEAVAVVNPATEETIRSVACAGLPISMTRWRAPSEDSSNGDARPRLNDRR